jgi:hypothetical protein
MFALGTLSVAYQHLQQTATFSVPFEWIGLGDPSKGLVFPFSVPGL